MGLNIVLYCTINLYKNEIKQLYEGKDFITLLSMFYKSPNSLDLPIYGLQNGH